jgi:rhamnosyltransferase subunit B
MPGLDFILCTLGTRGDFLPFLGLASVLLERGHRVTLLSNANWRDDAVHAGAAFESISGEDPTQSGRDDFAFFQSNTLPSFEKSFSFIARKAKQNSDCILVYRYNMLGAECAAERFNLLNAKIALQPSAIHSVERPPWPMTPLSRGRFGTIGRNIVIPFIYGIGEATRRYRRHANMFRKSVGCSPLTFGRRNEGPEDLLLMMCPEWFAMPQTDWPAHCRTVGFPFWNAGSSDGEIVRFIDRFGAPIVFTSGTGVSDVAGFFAKAGDLCRHLDMPGVFLSRHAPPPPPDLASQILVRDYVDLGHLLPRARMLVHHGGIGTTAQAIRCGIPQVIFAGRFDQPDNALRVAVLGLGAAVYSRNVGIDALGDRIRAMLASLQVRRQLDSAARLVAKQDALRISASLIEDCAERRRVSNSSESNGILPLRPRRL